MSPRIIISIALVAFVGVCIYFIVADESATSTTDSADVAQTIEETNQQAAESKSACAGCADEGSCSDEKIAAHTKGAEKGKVTTAGEKEVVAAVPQLKTIAYYFHGEVRCTTCKTIEAYTREVLNREFKAALDDGSLKFVDINLDEEKNEHFINEYELSSSSLVLVKLENGKQKKWKTLEKIWTLVQDEDAFKKYATSEIGGFVKVRS